MGMTNCMKPRKKTQGRKRIEIEEIKKKSNRQVTFSKRRNGLIRKASELCILCDVQVAVIAFSPGDKVFAFGGPDVDAVLDQYLDQNQVCGGQEAAETSLQDMAICRLREEYEKAVKKLREAKDCVTLVEECEEAAEGGSWWEEDIGGMGLEELECYKKGIQQLINNVAARIGYSSMVTKTGETEMVGADTGFLLHGSGCSTGFMDDANARR